jgi:hypothetical protein
MPGLPEKVYGLKRIHLHLGKLDIPNIAKLHAVP